MAGHPIGALAEAAGGRFAGTDPARPITHLAIDSRKPIPAEGGLFIALRGERHDGHSYIGQLIDKGVRCFVVAADHPMPRQANVDLQVVVVPDTLDALQRIAAWHRAHFRTPIIGITGSNGKTVVKEWLFHLLRDTERIVRSPGSWNSQVGVPLSVWELREGHSLGIFEAGISQPGEMDSLRATIKPTIGVFTNIGPAHGENFHSDHEKALEKLLLFADAEVLVHCADHRVVAEAIRQRGLDQRVELLGWSRERNGWLHVVNEQRTAHGTHITVMNDQASFAFDIPFTDPASVENALHCVTLLMHLGYGPAWIAERMPLLPPVAMRLEIVDGRHGTTLLNDAYSNDTASLAIALEQLDAMAGGRPKAVVLSDILQSSEDPGPLYHRVARLLEQHGVGRLFAIGPQLAAHRNLFGATITVHEGPDALVADIDPASIEGHAILVKGARSYALERVVAHWQRQVHGTVMEVDLDAIRHNLNHFRSLLAPGVRTMAMVKAFGYGNGALELARLFAHEQVHYLGVAYADEGIALRQEGVHMPILVMNPEPVPFETMHRFDLEAEVYDERSLTDALAHAKAHPGAPPVHLKLDTGMHRLGFGEDDLPNLLDALRQGRQLRVAGVLSHFAASEAPEHDDFTRAQLKLFNRMADAIDDVLGHRPLRHMANSAAAVRFPESQLDMVRLGIGLHGVGFDSTFTKQLVHAAALRSPIAQLRAIAAGETVGYGRRYSAPAARTIATLPIGYADGLSRRLGNGAGRLWLHGKPAPIVGNVCMDMVMIDVTDIPCQVGDMAYLFDAAHPITDLASDLGTIPYEVLTSIPPRVKRVYRQG